MTNRKESFLSLASWRDPVNQWLCLALLSVICFWVILYYFAQKAEIIGESLAAGHQAL